MRTRRSASSRSCDRSNISENDGHFLFVDCHCQVAEKCFSSLACRWYRENASLTAAMKKGHTQTAITTLAEKGLPDWVIQAQVGHVAPEMMKTYSHIRRQALCSAGNRHHPRRHRPHQKNSYVTTRVTEAGPAWTSTHFSEENWLTVLDDFRNSSVAPRDSDSRGPQGASGSRRSASDNGSFRAATMIAAASASVM
jgi:hypothetical protein